MMMGEIARKTTTAIVLNVIVAQTVTTGQVTVVVAVAGYVLTVTNSKNTVIVELMSLIGTQVVLIVKTDTKNKNERFLVMNTLNSIGKTTTNTVAKTQVTLTVLVMVNVVVLVSVKLALEVVET